MKKTLGCVLLGILAVVLIGYGITSAVEKKNPVITEGTVNDAYNNAAAKGILAGDTAPSEGTSASSAASTAAGTTAAAAANAVDDYEYAYAGFHPAYANLNISDWTLLLVNRDYILPDNYEVKLAPAVNSDPDGAKLDYRVAPHYNEMYLAAEKDGIELTPISGYRSFTRQRNNFERKINKYLDQGYSKAEATKMAATIILPPGTSEHNAGLAMDICSLEQSFDKTAEFRWLNEHAADYGFILRYTEEKQDVTKIIYEPWHWRYVGVENAKAIKASGKCLEEYLGAVS